MELLIQQQTSKRLIIIITPSLSNNFDLAHAVHWLAEPEALSILYLVLVSEKDNLLEISRNMATMKAVTAANRVSVDVKLAKFGNWLQTLHQITNPMDTLICQEEQTVGVGPFKTLPLGDFLSSHIDLPVQTMVGYYRPFQTMTKKWLREFFVTMVFLGILAGFTWLQIGLDQVLDSPITIIYTLLTFGIEIGLIWAWYKFITR